MLLEGHAVEIGLILGGERVTVFSCNNIPIQLLEMFSLRNKKYGICSTNTTVYIGRHLNQDVQTSGEWGIQIAPDRTGICSYREDEQHDPLDVTVHPIAFKD